MLFVPLAPFLLTLARVLEHLLGTRKTHATGNYERNKLCEALVVKVIRTRFHKTLYDQVGFSDTE